MAYAEHPNTRAGWMVGLGVGASSAGVSGGGSRETGVAASFRVGYVFRPDIAAGIESNLWSKEEGGATLTFSVSGASMTFYPGMQGLYLHGGVGVGTVSVSASSGNVTFSASDNGLGLTAGAGYEWRLARRFALGPAIDFSYASISGDSFNYVSGSLQANWYFIPKE